VDGKKDFCSPFTNETGEQKNEMISLRLCKEAEAKLGTDIGSFGIDIKSLALQLFFRVQQ